MHLTNAQTLAVLLALTALPYAIFGIFAFLDRLWEMREARRELRERALARLMAPLPAIYVPPTSR